VLLRPVCAILVGLKGLQCPCRKNFISCVPFGTAARTGTCAGGSICEAKGGKFGIMIYGHSGNCIWTFSSNAQIHIELTSRYMWTNIDILVLRSCTTTSCASSRQLARITDQTKTPIGVFSTMDDDYRLMQVEFTSSALSPAFQANWWASGNFHSCGCPMALYLPPLPCVDCPPYRIVCMDCPANSVSPIASTNITACVCNAGWHGANGEICVACAAGKYKSDTGDEGRQYP